MIYKITVCLLALLFPAAAFANSYDDMASDLLKKGVNKKNAIAVMPFSYEKDPDAGKIVSEEMLSALTSAGANVVERTQLDKVMKELSLQQTGLLSDQKAAQLGKGAGAKYMVLGSVSEFTKSGYQNAGLKITVRLVDIETFRVLSATSGEVDADDKISVYRNKGVRKAAEYPGFLGFFGGGTFLNDKASFDNGKSFNANLKPSFLLGIRYINENKGVFTRGYELTYNRQVFSDANQKYNMGTLGIPVLIRIPLWTYTNSMPNFTNLNFGIIFNGSAGQFDYHDGSSEKNSTVVGLGLDLVLGFKLGLNEFLSLDVEYRYRGKAVNYYWHGQDVGGDSKAVAAHLGGNIILVGFSLAP